MINKISQPMIMIKTRASACLISYCLKCWKK